MKYKLLILFTLLFFHTICSFAIEKKAKIDYEIIKSTEQPILKLTVVLIDTSKINSTSRFPPRPSTAPAPPNFDNFKAQIINSLNNNHSLDIFVKRPEYINEMLNFIQNQADKESAIKIFNENNYFNAVQTNVNQSISIKNGKTEKRITAELIIPLIIKSSTELIIESKNIVYEGNKYITDQLTIKIEK